MRPMRTANEAGRPAAVGEGSASVRRDASGLKSSYANFSEAAGSRDEFVLTFGVSRAWAGCAGEAEVSLSHRIVMSPFAAKGLALALARLVAEHEERHGILE